MTFMTAIGFLVSAAGVVVLIVGLVDVVNDWLKVWRNGIRYCKMFRNYTANSSMIACYEAANFLRRWLENHNTMCNEQFTLAELCAYFGDRIPKRNKRKSDKRK
jgi:hypothetical protein